jgi:ParB-like chromosome segregation protein Spo0J
MSKQSKFPLIKTAQVADLIPYARNSRTHSDEQITQISASIKEFGFLNPVIVDGENGIIAGHGRVMAAKKLGMTELPVVEASHLTDAQRRAYIIADNKLALNAGWDDEMLRVEFAELTEAGFDLDLTGFSIDEQRAINLDIDDIEQVDHFNDTFNFSITCTDLTELAMVQKVFGASSKKIAAAKLLEVMGA